MPTSFSDGLSGTGLILTESVKSFQKNGGFERSATLAFCGFLGLIPLLLLAAFILGRLAGRAEDGPQTLDRAVSQFLPLSHEWITKEIYTLSRERAWGFVTAIVLVWAVTPLAAALRNTFRAIFLPERRASFFLGKLFDLLFVLATLVAFIALVAARPFLSVALGVVAREFSYLALPVRAVGPFLILSLFLLVFYRVFVPVRTRWAHRLIGALTAAALLSAMGPLFTLILKYNPDYGVTFGSLKAIFFVFVWVYYAFAIILFGAELMANLARRDALVLRGLLAGGTETRKRSRLLEKFASAWAEGAVIFREGDEGEETFVVRRGAVALTRKGRPFRVIKPGEYFGEMAMLLGGPRTMTATVAGPDTELVKISADTMDIILRENPEIVFAILREMASRLKATDELAEGVQG